MDSESKRTNPESGETETITVAQLAERLQISLNHAYKLTREPGFPAVRLGASVRVPVRLLNEWLETAAQS